MKIEIRDLEFAYDAGGFRLTVAELEIESGARVAWTGPSGSGKTTLLNIVAGILKPTGGHIQCGGVDLVSLSEAERRDFRITNVGLVFQEFELLNYLSVLDNVLLAYRINRSLQLTSEVRQSARQLIEEVGLSEMLSRRPDQLSHGQRQRVAVCRSLITNPSLVLADEPTANLDPGNKQVVLDVLDAYAARSGSTLVVVTHDQQVATRLDCMHDFSAAMWSSAAAGGATANGG